MSPDNTRNCHIPLPSNISSDCKDVLVKIGLAEKPVVNKYGYESEFKSSCKFFHPTRHIPPTNPVDYTNISPVEGKTFCACLSMQNIQWLTTSGGLNKYICKYIGKIDENNYVIIRAHPHDPGRLVCQTIFLHNTKITSSSINEKRPLKRNEEKTIQKEEL